MSTGTDQLRPVEVGDASQVLRLSGRLDVAAAADLRLELASALQDGAGRLVVDLSGVTAVDATGLGLLVSAHRRAQRGGRTLVLREVPGPVRRLLLRSRLDRVLVVEVPEQAAAR